jgi:hypothetical protein
MRKLPPIPEPPPSVPWHDLLLLKNWRPRLAKRSIGPLFVLIGLALVLFAAVLNFGAAYGGWTVNATGHPVRPPKQKVDAIAFLSLFPLSVGILCLVEGLKLWSAYFKHRGDTEVS